MGMVNACLPLGTSYTRLAWPKSALVIKLLQGLGGGEDRNSAVTSNCKQISLARHNLVRNSGNSCGDHLIVVGVARHHARHLRLFHHFNRLNVVGKQLARRFSDDGDAFACK